MRASVADRSWILAVEIAVMTPRTASIVGATVSATVEAVVVVLIADLIVSFTEGIIVADLEVAVVSVGVTLVVVRTVGAVLQTSTARETLSPVTVVAVVGVGVGVRHVAHPVVHLALLAVPTPADVGGAGGVGAGAVGAVLPEVSTAWEEMVVSVQDTVAECDSPPLHCPSRQ